MLARPLSGSDDRGQVMIGVSSPPTFPLAVEGDDVNERPIGVSSSLSTPPHPCAFSSPSSLPPPHSPTPGPPCILLKPSPPPTLPVSLSTPLFISPHSVASSLPPSTSSPLPPHSPVFSVFSIPSLLPPPSLPPPPFAPPPLSSITSHSSSSSSPPFTSILPSSISPPPLSHFSAPSSSCRLLPAFSCPLPSSLCPPSVSSSFSLPLFSSAASLPPASSVSSSPPPHSSVICSPSTSPSVSAALHPSSPPPPLPSCCSCSSLLPRLLSAHRLEVRRLLRGALSSLGRRLDSLERKSRRKKRRRRQAREDPATFTCSCSPTPITPLASSSSSSASSFSTPLSLDREDSYTPISKSEQRKSSGSEEKVRARKRRRENRRAKGEKEEDAGRFAGQMAVSFTGRRRGAEEKELLNLHDFNHRRREQGETDQSEKAVSVVVRQNGYSSSSHHALHLLQSAQSGWTSSQSEARYVSFVQWHFSNSTPSSSLYSNHSFSHRWLCCSSSFSPSPMLLLSAVAVETVSELVRGGACGSPPWPLKDWTAPPSLSSDHCYVRLLTPSLTFSAQRQQKQRANHIDQSVHLPLRWPLPLPPCSVNGVFAQIPAIQSATESRFLNTGSERSKRVSQIRIRRATPRETLLTPMGLPKIRRLKKKEFSLEEIYTNKNYKSPTTNRSLETIFEEPREKDGALLLIGQQRRRRLLHFPDFTQPRKRKKPQGGGHPVTVVPRKRAARRHCHGYGSCDDNVDLDVMLLERLSALEDFLTQQGLDL